MSYRNKTYVAFASENIQIYNLMKAWNANENIEFDFHDAHDLNTAQDTSKPETIKRRLRERLSNTKQVILLGSSDAKKKGSDGSSFLAYEVGVLLELDLPVIIANIDGNREVDRNFIPLPFIESGYYTLSVSLEAKIVKHGLDQYAPRFAESDKQGPHQYPPSVYEKVGL